MAQTSPDFDDGGFKSRKVVFAFVSLALIFGGWILTAPLPALAASYTTLVGAIMGVLGLFIGGQLGHQFVTGSNVAKIEGSMVEEPIDENVKNK